jgi:hypothetical protein
LEVAAKSLPIIPPDAAAAFTMAAYTVVALAPFFLVSAFLFDAAIAHLPVFLYSNFVN